MKIKPGFSSNFVHETLPNSNLNPNCTTVNEAILLDDFEVHLTIFTSLARLISRLNGWAFYRIVPTILMNKIQFLFHSRQQYAVFIS